MPEGKLNRRGFMSRAVGVSTVGAMAGVLGSCAEEEGQPQSQETTGAKAEILPTYEPDLSVTPDLVGEDGVLNGFLAYPEASEPSREAPGEGGTVSVHVEVNSTAPPVSGNSYWQELNKRLNVNFELNGAPAAAYKEKLATLFAGGDLPDLVQLKSIPNLADALRVQFQDLTDYVAGDAVLEYPSLAALPTQSWKNTIFNGGIYGIPFPQPAIGNLMLYREDVIGEKGLSSDITSGDDLLELCRELTDLRHNRWAHASPVHMVLFISQMMGAPNEWAESNGEFSYGYASEAYRNALEVGAQMWDEGLFHPDSFTGVAQRGEWFGNGTVSLSYNGYSTWVNYIMANRPGNSDFEIGALPSVKWDGSGATPKFLNKGIYTFTAVKQSDPDRVRELLRVADWLSTPWGTNEQRFRKYGIEGKHHTIVDGDLILTELGESEIKLPLYYVAKEVPTLYTPGYPEETKEQYQVQVEQVPTGVYPAHVGLASETAATKATQLETTLVNFSQEVIQGRMTLAEWDKAVGDWRSGGGDAITAEYEEAYAAAN